MDEIAKHEKFLKEQAETIKIMREGIEMIGKICRSKKHKHPLSDIECEVNRVKRRIRELLAENI